MTARPPDQIERRASPHHHEIIEEAANAAVKKTFAILGVDVDKPESVEEFREDLRFGRRLRKMSDHGWMVGFGLVVGGILFLIWTGVKAATGIRLG